MKKIKLMMVLLFLSTGTVMAQEAKVTSLMTKDLTEIPGREVLMITVEYAPGGVDPIHRHNAHAFVYVLEGSIVMQVKGGKEVTLTPGQTFYEGPDDVHIVGRNASSTKPAKFLVFLVKEKGAYKCVGVATETGAAQFFHRHLATQNQTSAAQPTNKTQATNPEPARRAKSIMQFRETI